MRQQMGLAAYKTVRKAIGERDWARLRHLFDRGLSPDARRQDGSTLLHSAAYYGDVKLARVLLECRASPNAPDEHGATPLHYAAARGHGQLVEQLIAAGADVQAATDDRQTSAHYAARLAPPETRAGVAELLASPSQRVFAQSPKRWAAHLAEQRKPNRHIE